MHLFRNMSARQHWLHAVLFFFAIHLLSKPVWLGNNWHELAKALGEAFLIGLMVIYLVEAESHKRLEETAERMIRKTGKNIIPLIYGHELPTPLVEALEASTLQQPVYRDRMHLDVELLSTQLPLADGTMEDLCLLKNTYSYALVNCSDEPVKKPITISLEIDKWLGEKIPNGASDPVLEYVKVGTTLYVDEDKAALCREKLNLQANCQTLGLLERTSPSADGNALVFELPEAELPPHGRLEIVFSGLLYKRYSDNEVWLTAFPTLGVNLCITSTDFEVDARFPDSDHKIGKNQGEMTNRWIYDAPLLAGQTVLFWWRPKKK